MQKEEFSVLSSTDGLELSGMVMFSENAKGILLIVHGMCEHKERYYDFMEYVAARGYVCGIYDQRGHGRSLRKDEDLGYFYREGRKAVVEDVQDVVNFLKEKFQIKKKGMPFVLLGHSMGSMVARTYLKNYDQELDGLIVMGSPSKRTGITAGKVLVRGVQMIKGSHGHSRLLDWLAVNCPYETRFAKEELPHAWISTDKAVVKAYNGDSKCNFTFTVNGYKVLFYLMGQTYNKKGFQIKNPALPVLFLAGREDPCIINETHFKKAIDNLKQAGYQKVTGKLYERMRHEILNEKERRQVYKEVLSFVENLAGEKDSSQ